jgi:hypothetical protein
MRPTSLRAPAPKWMGVGKLNCDGHGLSSAWRRALIFLALCSLCGAVNSAALILSLRATNRAHRVPPTAQHRSWCAMTNATVPAKPWVGVRRQRHMLASERRRTPARSFAAPRSSAAPRCAGRCFT